MGIMDYVDESPSNIDRPDSRHTELISMHVLWPGRAAAQRSA